MVDEQDGRARAVPHPGEERRQRLGLRLRQAAGGLVEQEQVGVVREHAGELHDPAGAGRQLVHELVGVRDWS